MGTTGRNICYGTGVVTAEDGRKTVVPGITVVLGWTTAPGVVMIGRAVTIREGGMLRRTPPSGGAAEQDCCGLIIGRADRVTAGEENCGDRAIEGLEN